jgi:hypothetical protein
MELAGAEFRTLIACGCTLLILRLGSAWVCGSVLLLGMELKTERYA